MMIITLMIVIVFRPGKDRKSNKPFVPPKLLPCFHNTRAAAAPQQSIIKKVMNL
jgi:hypothetical protein